MKKNIHHFGATLAASILLNSVVAQAWEYQLYANVGEAKISGLAQTPKGGNIGTTSMNRPTFAEIDMSQDHLSKVGVGIEHETFFSQLAYQDLSPHGNTDLSSELMTHSQLIPAGSNFNEHVHYHLTTLVIGKKFTTPHSGLILSPLLQGDYVRYHYGFSTPVTQSLRDFNLAGVSAGLLSQYQISDYFAVDLSAKHTLPLSKLIISQLDIGVNYRYAFKKHFTLVPRLEVGFIKIDYEDNQTVPNHIRYQALPYGTLGLGLTFSD